MQIEDIVKGNLATALGVSLAVVLASRVFPQFRPTLRSLVKLGIGLATESAAEAEAEITERLVASTIEALIGSYRQPGPAERRRALAMRRLQRFKQRARVHAHRWTQDRSEEEEHYRRMLHALQRRLERERRRQPPPVERGLAEAAAQVGDPLHDVG